MTLSGHSRVQFETPPNFCIKRETHETRRAAAAAAAGGGGGGGGDRALKASPLQTREASCARDGARWDFDVRPPKKLMKSSTTKTLLQLYACPLEWQPCFQVVNEKARTVPIFDHTLTFFYNTYYIYISPPFWKVRLSVLDQCLFKKVSSEDQGLP